MLCSVHTTNRVRPDPKESPKCCHTHINASASLMTLNTRVTKLANLLERKVTVLSTPCSPACKGGALASTLNASTRRKKKSFIRTRGQQTEAADQKASTTLSCVINFTEVGTWSEFTSKSRNKLQGDNICFPCVRRRRRRPTWTEQRHKNTH